MKKLLLGVLLLLLLLISVCSSEPPSIELISSLVKLVDGVNHGVVYDETGKLVTHTVLEYKFVLKNTGTKSIGSKKYEKGIDIKIIPNKNLKEITEEVMRKNIYDEIYSTNGTPKGTETGGSVVSRLMPNQEGEYEIRYFLGTNEKNDRYKAAPPKEKLEKLKRYAMYATLIVLIDGKEVARFELNNGQQDDPLTKAEFYRFSTNTLLTLEDINKAFTNIELHLKPQGEGDYPSLNGVQSKVFELYDGTVFIHLFNSHNDLELGLKQFDDNYKPNIYGLKVYEINNILLVYIPAYATEELIASNDEKIKKTINEMIKVKEELRLETAKEAQQNLSLIKEELKLGLSQEAVQSLFSENYKKVKSAMDDSVMWRYDFGAREGYTSPDDGYDFADIKGLQSGMIQVQLFISWNSEYKVNRYSVIYLNGNDGKIYEYHLFSDGEEKEQAIN